MDQIRIDNLEVYAHHGVYEEEQRTGQHFYVNLVLYGDMRGAGRTDDLELSTDYGEVCHFVDQWMREHTRRLLEAAAEDLAQELLLKFPRVRELDLEIRKPQAPIGLPFESVSVRIRRGWHRAYLGLGSNMGDRRGYLEQAVAQLGEDRRIRLGRRSSLIETKPYGGVPQGDFLNGCLEIDTLLTPYELLDVLHGIEAKAQRRRTLRWGPRTLDLDILFYDDLVCGDGNLEIPHPDLQNRDFVLRPMAELAPGLRHPVLGRTIRQLLRELESLPVKEGDQVPGGEGGAQPGKEPGEDSAGQKEGQIGKDGGHGGQEPGCSHRAQVVEDGPQNGCEV